MIAIKLYRSTDRGTNQQLRSSQTYRLVLLIQYVRGTAILWPCTKVVAEKTSENCLFCKDKARAEYWMCHSKTKLGCSAEDLSMCHSLKKLKTLILVVVKLIFVVVVTIYIFYNYF